MVFAGLTSNRPWAGRLAACPRLWGCQAIGLELSKAFMDMNLQAVRGDSKPKVVLYQFDQDNAMNPHGLLIAYAEATVKPVWTLRPPSLANL